MKLIIGNKYKFKHQTEMLTYVGKKSGWYRFSSSDNFIYSVLRGSLNMLEGDYYES